MFFIQTLAGQQPVTIKASVDKNNIVIGQHIQFHVEASFPRHEPMRFFIIDTIPHFEVLDRKKIDTLDSEEGIKLSQNFTLTSFDSGHWVIPPFELPGEKPLYTDSITMDVGFSPFDPNQDYHDIKDVIDVKAEEKKEQDWYWYVGATVLLVTAIIYMLTGKKKNAEGPKVSRVDPFTEAKKELDKLRKENLSSKIYYSRLVDIFRIYLSRRKGIASLQKTTDDLVAQLQQLHLPAEDFKKLAQALLMSDFVKFAKYEPSETDKTDSFNIVKNSIEQVEKLARISEKNK